MSWISAITQHFQKIFVDYDRGTRALQQNVRGDRTLPHKFPFYLLKCFTWKIENRWISPTQFNRFSSCFHQMIALCLTIWFLWQMDLKKYVKINIYKNTHFWSANISKNLSTSIAVSQQLYYKICTKLHGNYHTLASNKKYISWPWKCRSMSPFSKIISLLL